MSTPFQALIAQVPGSTPTGSDAPAAPTTGTPQAPAGGGLGLLLPMMLVLVAMVVFTSLAGRKQRKAREATLAAVKRNDRVVTTSGVIGTIIDLTDTEMTLRVDEGTDTRIRFRRGAIDSIMKDSKST